MKIYITHCCAKKEETLKNTDTEVNPDQLYTATPTQRFMKKCKEHNVEWAIFSDLYGVWFPYKKNKWYEKHPKNVSEEEFKLLLNDFDKKLQKYDEIWFYYNPGRFHSLYKRLLEKSDLREKVVTFSHLCEI